MKHLRYHINQNKQIDKGKIYLIYIGRDSKITEVRAHFVYDLRNFLKISITRHQLSNYMKFKLKYSYLKRSYRPIKISKLKHILWKGLFSFKFLKILLTYYFISNFDESSFNWDVGRDYCWLPRIERRISQHCCLE